MLIDEEVGVQTGISELADFACFGVFSAVLRVTNDDLSKNYTCKVRLSASRRRALRYHWHSIPFLHKTQQKDAPSPGASPYSYPMIYVAVSDMFSMRHHFKPTHAKKIYL